jgi:homoserine trans-succinylase|tara:strand:+ start:715 stop:942 length:228 start_codon:yes stop_codon:yes gene_type:complete
MSINNQIFDYYRKQQQKIQEAKQLLEENGYTVNEKKKSINQEIKRLESQLTGFMDKDIQTNKDIYRLRRMLKDIK